MLGAARHVVAMIALGAIACGEPTPPPWEPPDLGDRLDEGDGGAPFLPEPPRIPWLEAGEPPVEAPRIPWLEAGEPPVAPPEIPWLGSGVPPAERCPDGWRVATTDGVTWCDPWPETGRNEACDIDEAHFVGTPGCARLGASADAGWPRDLPAGAPILYVDDDAAGGDGTTRATAFASLEVALAAARPGDIVAIAEGRYEGAFDVPAGVTLWGASVASTVITSDTPSEDTGVILVGAADVTVRNLRIADAARPGITVSGRAALQDVVVERTHHRGVVVSGGSLDAEALVVRAIEVGDDDRGVGIDVNGGGRATLRRLWVSECVGLGVVVGGIDSSIEMRDAGVVRTAETATSTDGTAIVVVEGARVTLDLAVLADNAELGLLLGAGATGTIKDALLSDNGRAIEGGRVSGGLLVTDGGSLITDRLELRENRFGAASLAGGRLVMRDAWFSDAPLGADGSGGSALLAERGTIDASRVVVERAAATALVASQTEVTIADATIRVGSGDQAAGGLVTDGGTLRLSRVEISEVAYFGLVSQTDAQLIASDVRIEDIEPSNANPYGVGVHIDAASVELERVVIRRATFEGVATRRAGALVARDLLVTETRPLMGFRGNAVSLLGSATLEHVLLEHQSYAGLVAFAEGATIDDLVVRDSTRQPSDGEFGVGVLIGAPDVVISRVSIEGSSVAGVLLYGETATAQIADARVRGGASPDDPGDAGFYLIRGAALDLERADVSGTGVACFFGEDRTQFAIVDALCADIQEGSTYTAGLWGQFDAAFTLERVAFRNVIDAAIELQRSSTGTLTDVSIEGVTARPGQWLLGLGIDVTISAFVEGERIRIRDTGLGGIGLQLGGHGRFRDLSIQGTRGVPADDLGGFGVFSGVGATPPLLRPSLELESFAIEGSATCGVLVGETGALDLHDGEVRSTPIGACIQNDGFDNRRLQRGVRYRDVGSPLQNTVFTLPTLAPEQAP
ncbi:MAG: hypothetical protein H6719_00495 [Sandaracinaceae bacterium]|nr:hypothetical protein [Sandaracinaceae bacterium]